MESTRIKIDIDDINQKNSVNVYKLISRGEDAEKTVEITKGFKILHKLSC